MVIGILIGFYLRPCAQVCIVHSRLNSDRFDFCLCLWKYGKYFFNPEYIGVRKASRNSISGYMSTKCTILIHLGPWLLFEIQTEPSFFIFQIVINISHCKPTDRPYLLHIAATVLNGTYSQNSRLSKRSRLAVHGSSGLAARNRKTFVDLNTLYTSSKGS